jgi:hypothetical protein
MLESIPLRSKSVDRVRQEIWGLLIAYNLIRLEMERAADAAGGPPTRISFVAVFRMICGEWLWCAGASLGAIPRYLRRLRENISLFVLPPRRRERSYPRAVKIKMSSYPRKRRPSDTRAPQGIKMIQHSAYLTGISPWVGVSWGAPVPPHDPDRRAQDCWGRRGAGFRAALIRDAETECHRVHGRGRAASRSNASWRTRPEL